MIETVLFDADQTLWDFQRVMRQALTTMVAELQTARPGPFSAALTWEDLNRDRSEVATELEGVEFYLTRLRVLGFARTLARRREHEGEDVAADDRLAQQLSTSYFEHRDRDPALFDDTVACLESLRTHYLLGLLSNGSRLPDRVGLGGFFESVVFAQDHGAAKPDRRLFAVSERELGLHPGACVLVGDHPLNDVVGAKRAGWRAIWIDREGSGPYVAPAGCDERPDATITSFAQLPDALLALQQLG